MSVPAEAKWYLLHTYSGYENKVKSDLEKIINNETLKGYLFKVAVPVRKIVKANKNGEEKPREQKIFPGYVLVNMIITTESWYIVRNVRGVTGFVGPGTDPVCLSEAEVDSLGLDNPDKVDDVQIVVDYKVGDNVIITAGNLKDSPATVTEIDIENKRVKVSVNFLGRLSTAELSIWEVALQNQK